jgi:PIN domain nuclease of toxin-antitoxin system
MKVLLDIHVFLWLITGDDRLSENAQKTFLDPGNRLFFSAASLNGYGTLVQKVHNYFIYTVILGFFPSDTDR